jgi:hypothetical protein
MDVYGSILDYSNSIVIHVKSIYGFWKVLECISKVYVCIIKYENILQWFHGYTYVY